MKKKNLVRLHKWRNMQWKMHTQIGGNNNNNNKRKKYRNQCKRPKYFFKTSDELSHDISGNL